MSVLIRGLGTVVPSHSISQSDAAELASGFCCSTTLQAKQLSVLYRRTGVRTRYSVILDTSTNGEPAQQTFYADAKDAEDAGPTTSARMQRYETDASRLANAATTQALQNSGIDPRQVTHLVTVSCSGFSAPGFDISLIRNVPLQADVERTHIGFMGCHGALNGLRVARAFVEANPQAVVLLCAVELCSLHQQYGWDPEQIVANALFADGAAAVVLTSDSFASTSSASATHSVTSFAELKASASHVLPNSVDFMTWRIGNNGFEMTLSAQLPDLIRAKLAEWLSNWLSGFGLDLSDIAGWVVHPGGPRVLSATSHALGLDKEHLQCSRAVLADYGNMSSPTVLFILDRLRSQGTTGPCVMLGYGPGITIEAALLEL